MRAVFTAVALLALATSSASPQTPGTMWAMSSNQGATPQAASGVKGINPTGGGWLLMTNLSSANLSAMVSDLRSLGVQWVRWDMDANSIDPSCGPMSWGNNDAVINALHGASINILALLNQAPGCMNGSGPATQGPTTSAGRISWAAFAQAVVQRYGASGSACVACIQAYEIWNEPNCAQFWTGPNGADPVNYGLLIAAAYAAIKSADPAAGVVVGGMASCGSGGSGPNTTINAQQFLADLYDHGLRGNETAVGDHPYCASPVGTLGCDNIRKMYDSTYLGGSGSICRATGTPTNCTLLSIMAEYGDAGEKIWSTEFGRGTSQASGGKNVDQTQQATDLTSYYTLLNSNAASWAGPGFWYNYQDFVVAHGTGGDGNAECTTSDDPPGNICMGLELYNGSGVGAQKLGYTAFQKAL
jgi:hypothetical protein